MALSIKDGTGAGASLKTTLDGANHRPHHIIDEISGSSIGAVNTSLSSIDTKSTSVSSSLTSIDTKSTNISSSLASIDTKSTGISSSLSSIDTKSISISSSLASISSSVRSLSYSSATSTAVFTFAQNADITSGSATSFIVTNLTNSPLYIILGSTAPSPTSYSYIVPISGTYESIPNNARLEHSVTASFATLGTYSVTVTR